MQQFSHKFNIVLELNDNQPINLDSYINEEIENILVRELERQGTISGVTARCSWEQSTPV